MDSNRVRWYTNQMSGKRFPYSSLVDIKKKADNKLCITIKNPGANMQTDAANFESLALMCRCVEPGCKVEIDFALSGWEEMLTRNKVKTIEVFPGWDEKFGQKTPGSNAYLRFLYRAAMFKCAYEEWVSFSKTASEEIDKFKKELKSSEKPTNNIPDKKAEYNRNKGEEHRIENKLVYTKDGKKHLKTLYNEYASEVFFDATTELNNIYNQLPNGLFDAELSNSKRIFTTGFYDIWGIDNKGNLCIFELKKPGNDRLGVISELFFYAAYASDVLLNIERLHEPTEKFRGYDILYNSIKDGEIKGVRAFFLLPEKGGHKYINQNKEKLLEELNGNTKKIHFGFLYYEPGLIDKISEKSFCDEVIRK